jgi:ureidoglycolate amidohydrolase
MTALPGAHLGRGTRPQLHAAIAELAKISTSTGRGITREVFTPGYSQACAYTRELMEEAGLTVRFDAFGNLWGSWPGCDPGMPSVLTGSHIDTTLDAGAYDGVLGVLGAIAAVADLRAAGFTPRRTIEVIAFAGEEPRFGSGCIGSRALMGRLSRGELDTMVDRDGVSIAVAMRDSGFDPDRIAEVAIAPESIHAFVELHIEQGAVLESDETAIGIVHRIAAPHDLRVTLTGRAMHAGATPMRLRRDAFAGAAEAAVAFEAIVRESPSDAIVGTIGKLAVYPGAINVIPGQVVFEVDVRDSELGPRKAVIDAFQAELAGIASRRGLGLEIEPITEDTPAACDQVVVDAVTSACRCLEIPATSIVSGAFHDAMILGRQIKMGMIFVPSRNGLSHHPDEYTAPEQLDLGVDVLAETLARLAT